jgi:hypothetical protein
MNSGERRFPKDFAFRGTCTLPDGQLLSGMVGMDSF